MKIQYKIGDVTEAVEPVIAHGCNSRGVMGSGVAKAIREKFPRAYTVYHDFCILGARVGTNIWVLCDEVSPPKTIVNCITQENYGYDGQQYVDYEAVKACIENINTQAVYRRRMSREDQFDAFALPMIGSALGGGDWDILEYIIEANTPDVQPVVYRLQ